MPKYILFILCLMAVSPAAQAQQANFLLLGKLLGAEGQGIKLEIDKKYYNNSKDDYVVEVNENGRFGFVASLDFAQLVVLNYRGKRLELFAAPGDTLSIESHATVFPKAVVFNGNAAANNRHWQTYKAQFAPDVPIYQQINYKKGIYYYQLGEGLDSLMKNTKDSSFLAILSQKKEAQANWKKSIEKEISPAFSQFLQADMHYGHWLQRLAYGHIYRYRHQIDSTYFNVFDTLKVSNDAALSNAKYRSFLMAFLNYQYEKKTGKLPSTPEIFEGQYALTKTLYKDKSQYFVLAYLVEKALQTEFLERVAPLYEDFLKTNPYLELDQIVTDAFQQQRPFTEGTPAPNFFLQDTLGNGIGLRDFQGKTIYLGFWASWCRPCMQKMRELESQKASLADKDIVFIHVSLDNEAEQWRKTIAKQQFSGVHLLANPAILKDYKVWSVPKFFVISKDGNFELDSLDFLD